MRAGLRRVLDEIQPDVFHAHYAVEHGFYGAFADYHPYVVSAWGSDLLVESHKPLGKRIAGHALWPRRPRHGQRRLAGATSR